MPNIEQNSQEVLIHRWGPQYLQAKNIKLLGTTLRDGVQASGEELRQPTIQEKLRIIDFDAEIGVDALDICMPGNEQWYEEGVVCAEYIHEKYPWIDVTVLTRTTSQDVDATMRFAKETGVPLTAILFRGSSDLRLIAEEWDEDAIVEDMFKYTRMLAGEGVRVIGSTEDTTRTRPEFLKRIFTAAKEGGAQGLCIADTVGYADPYSTEAITKWVKDEIVKESDMEIQFHGHADTGQSSANALAAWKGGAQTVHVTWLGVGERAGNTDLGEVLGQLNTHNIDKYNLKPLMAGSEYVSMVMNRIIPVDKPLVGKVAYRSSTGIHAAGIHNARKRGREDIAELVYNAVPASALGRDIEITIGFLSGKHNYEYNGIDDSQLGELILGVARKLKKELTPSEVEAIKHGFEGKDIPLIDFLD